MPKLNDSAIKHILKLNQCVPTWTAITYQREKKKKDTCCPCSTHTVTEWLGSLVIHPLVGLHWEQLLVRSVLLQVKWIPATWPHRNAATKKKARHFVSCRLDLAFRSLRAPGGHVPCLHDFAVIFLGVQLYPEWLRQRWDNMAMAAVVFWIVREASDTRSSEEHFLRCFLHYFSRWEMQCILLPLSKKNAIFVSWEVK